MSVCVYIFIRHVFLSVWSAPVLLLKEKICVDYLSVDTWIMKASDKCVLGVVLRWEPQEDAGLNPVWWNVFVTALNRCLCQFAAVIFHADRFKIHVFPFLVLLHKKSHKCKTTFVLPCSRSFGVLYFLPSTSRPHIQDVCWGSSVPVGRQHKVVQLYVVLENRITCRHVQWRKCHILYRNQHINWYLRKIMNSLVISIKNMLN